MREVRTGSPSCDSKVELCRDEKEKRVSRKVAGFYASAAESMIVSFPETEETKEEIWGPGMDNITASIPLWHLSLCVSYCLYRTPAWKLPKGRVCVSWFLWPVSRNMNFAQSVFVK